MCMAGLQLCQYGVQHMASKMCGPLGLPTVLLVAATACHVPRLQVYFSPEWLSLLEVSFRNFLAGVMRCLPLPAVLRFNTDRRLRLALQQQVSGQQQAGSQAQSIAARCYGML